MKQNRFFLNRNEPLGNFMDFKKMFHGETCDYCEGTGRVEVNNPRSQGESIIPCPKCQTKGEAKSRATDPETSEQAAESVRGSEAARVEGIVLSALKRHPHGLTNHEIVEATRLAWNTCTPRIRPLVRKGLVVDSGERRQGCTNRKCVVWKAV